MHEVEAKVAVTDPDAVRARMKELGAPLGRPRLQDDVFFQHPQRDLARTDEALRLRTQEGFQELTYKGPKLVVPGPSTIKARREWNVPVGADPTPVLEALGFRPAARLCKHREQARLEACEVTLDHVDGLGWFVEVESLHEDPARGAAAVRKTLARLELHEQPPIETSYLELLIDSGARTDP